MTLLTNNLCVTIQRSLDDPQERTFSFVTFLSVPNQAQGVSDDEDFDGNARNRASRSVQLGPPNPRKT